MDPAAGILPHGYQLFAGSDCGLTSPAGQELGQVAPIAPDQLQSRVHESGT